MNTQTHPDALADMAATLSQTAASLSQIVASLAQLTARMYDDARGEKRGPANTPPVVDPVIPFDDPKPVAAKPVAAKPVAAKPVAAKPVAAKPVAAKPVAAKPVAAKPVAAKPVAAKPVAAKPVAARAAVDTGPDEHSERDVRNALLAVQAATSRDTAMAILAEVCGDDVRTAASVAVDDYARLIDRCNEVAAGGAE